MKIWLPSVRSNSGGDVYVERLAALLAETGCEPVVTWFPLRCEVFPWLLRAARVPKGVDVIHATSWNAWAFSGKRCPLVVTVHHCVRGRGYPAWKGRLQSLYHDQWVGRFEALSFAKAQAVVAVSASTAAEVMQTFSLNNVEVIGNWLDTDVFKPSFAPLARPPRVLWVGNPSLRKGSDMLPAFRQRLDADIELHVVAGRRGATSALHTLGPNVRVWSELGQADLVKLYQDCDVTVCLSRHEGFGYSALEAMACGRPVVAFNVSGLRDVIVDGQTGVLRCCEDLVGVADSCRFLIDNPGQARAMGMAGRHRAEHHFAAARAATRYIGVYRHAIASFRSAQL